ncbi:MAG: hypothetical protein ACFFFH_18910 [Candidatus Thorarchaeota archaeon]
MSKAKPEIGRFDYPTGWFERLESALDRTRSIRLTWSLFIISLVLFFGPISLILVNFAVNQWLMSPLITVSFLGFWIFLSAAIYL